MVPFWLAWHHEETTSNPDKVPTIKENSLSFIKWGVRKVYPFESAIMKETSDSKRDTRRSCLLFISNAVLVCLMITSIRIGTTTNSVYGRCLDFSSWMILCDEKWAPFQKTLSNERSVLRVPSSPQPGSYKPEDLRSGGLVFCSL